MDLGCSFKSCGNSSRRSGAACRGGKPRNARWGARRDKWRKCREAMPRGLILEGRAHLATAEEVGRISGWRRRKALEEAQQRQMADKVQVNVISDADLRAMKSAIAGGKAVGSIDGNGPI